MKAFRLLFTTLFFGATALVFSQTISSSPTFNVDEGGVVSEPINLSDYVNYSGSENLVYAISVNGRYQSNLSTLVGTQFTYKHDGSESTSDVVQFTVQAGSSEAVVGILNFTINPVNDKPRFPENIQPIQVDEGGVSSPLTINAFDAESDPIDYTVVTEPQYGQISIENGILRYYHNGSETSSDSFVIKAFEVGKETSIFTNQPYEVTISAVNDAPTASIIEDIVNEGGTKAFTFGPVSDIISSTYTFLDSDTNQNQISFRISQTPTNGTTSVSGKTITYVHNGSETISDSFQYEVFDGSLSTRYTASLTITPVNDAPVATDDLYFISSGEEAIEIASSIGLLQNDSDLENDSLSVVIESNPSSGTAVLQADGSFTYTPSSQGFTSDTFTYTVSDGNGGSDTGTVTIESNSIRPTPDFYTLSEGATLTIDSATGILINDIDTNNLSISAEVVTQPSFGTLILAGDGSFEYVHDGTDNLRDTFTYKVTNANGDESRATQVILILTNVNDAPVSSNTSITVNEGASVSFVPNFIDTDTASTAITFSVASNDQSTNAGTLVLNEQGSLTYTHNGSEVFTDSFTFTVSDGEFISNQSTIRVTVIPTNDSAIISSESTSLSVNEDQSISQEVTVNDAEGDDVVLFIESTDRPSNGSLAINGTTIIYTHNGSENFTDSFSLKAFDGKVFGDPQRFTVSITELNDAPVVREGAILTYSVNEGEAIQIPLSTIFIDEEGDPILFEISDPTNGEISISGNTYTYTHDGSETATDSFTVTAFNSSESEDQITQKISLIIRAVNDLPSISGLDNLTIDQLDELTIVPTITRVALDQLDELTFQVLDPDDAESDIEITLTKNSGKFSFVTNTDGSFTLFDENTSDAGFNDTYSFTITATDSSGESTDKVVSVTVADIEENLPQVVLRSDNLSVEEGGNLVIKASLINNDFYSKRRNLPDAFSNNFQYIGKYNGHVYYRYIGGMSAEDPNNNVNNLTYSEAVNIATSVGGYPLVLETEAEYDAFNILVDGTNYKVWLGYVSNGSAFSWVNGATTTYPSGFPWASGFPLDVNTNRGSSFNTSTGEVTNSSITQRNSSGLIVEFDQLVVIGDEPVTFTVDVTGTASISGDTADFSGITAEAVITIPANTDDEYTITLPTIDDSEDEETETVIITARSDSNDNFLVRKSKSRVVFSIRDNDDTGVTYQLTSTQQDAITSTDTSFDVNENVGELALNVTLNKKKTYDTFLQFDLSSDDAVANEDYSSPNIGYIDAFLTDGGGINGLSNVGTSAYYISNNRRITVYDTQSETTSYINENFNGGEIAASYDAVESFDVVRFRNLRDMSADASGNLFVIDDYYIRKLDTESREVYFIAGNTRGNNPVDEQGSLARFVDPRQIAAHPDGNILYIYDTRQIRRVNIDSNGVGTVSTVAGVFNNYGRSDGSIDVARIGNVQDMEVANNGDLYFADEQYIRKYSDGQITTVKWINEQISGIDLTGNSLYISTRWSNQLLKLNLTNDQLVTLVDSRNNSARERLNGPLDEATVSDVIDAQLLSDQTLLFVEQTNTGQHIRKLDFINKIRIKAGETTASYTLNILDDNVYELPETIVVTPSVGDGIAVDDSEIAIRILSNDPEPEVQLTASSLVVNESDENVVVTVQLGNAAEASAKSDLDAVAASQYTFMGDFEGSKYYISNFNRTWSEAKLEAEQLGGSLVVINSASENEFVRANRPNNNSVWIGYSDSENEGSFVWANGSNSTYTNWQNGQPDNAGDEDFTELTNNGRWNDLPQWINLPYVIEFSGVKSSIDTQITLAVDSIDNGATAGSDFTAPQNLVLTIPAGQNKVTTTFGLIDDADSETAEFIQISIFEVAGGVKSEDNGVVRVEILDNDPSIVALSASAIELSEVGSPISITATSQIAKQTETTLVLNLNSNDSDTADENKDYFIPELSRISTIAGSGQRGYVEGKGELVRFRGASKMAELPEVGFLIADQENHVIRLISYNGEVSTYIGNGNGWSNQNQNGRNRLEVAITGPSDIAISSTGEVFIAEAWQNRISKIDVNGNYQVVANSSGEYNSENNDNALLATFRNPRAIEFDSQGILYVVENENRIRKITFGNGTASVSDFTGSGQNGNQNGTLAEATFQGPNDIIIDENDVMYIAEHNRIRKITPQGIVSTLAGQWWGENDGSFQTAQFRNPSALAFDALGNILVADDDHSSLRILYLNGDKQGQVETLIGKKGAGFADGAFENAKLNRPRGVVANAGRILIADSDNNRIRQITLVPTITIPAGETSGSITIAPIDDYKFESDETLSLSVASTTNVNEEGSVLEPLAITLVSEDAVPSVRLQSSVEVISEASGVVEFSVRLSDQFSTTKPDMDAAKKGNYYYLGEFNGSHYYASKQDGWASYNEAKRLAESLGGSLAIISSQQENDFITNKIFEMDPEWDPNDNRWLQHWIGYAYDQNEPAQWKWSNGQEFEYSNWQGDNYLRNAENRPFARLHENGRWDIAGNNDHQRYVVEFSGATSDIDTSVALAITGSDTVTETDYEASATETLTIPAGAYKGTFTITGLDDNLDEPIETLNVTISAIEGSGVSIDENNRSVSLQINDNDLTTATIASSATGAISEVDGAFEITATLANAKPYPVVIDLSFDSESAGAAIFGKDYTSSSLNKTSTIAGSGSYGFVDGAALSAQFQTDIRGLVADKDGNLYIADSNRSVIRKYDASTKTVSTYVGTPNGGGNLDEGSRTEVRLGYVRSIASDTVNNRIYFYDDWTRFIRAVDLISGQVSFIAGNNSGNGNDGSATEASFQNISAMAVDATGDVFMIDNTQLRKIDITNGSAASVTTLAGAYNNGGHRDGFGDDVRISWADLKGMAFDLDGNLIFTDGGQNRVRKYNTTTGEVTTIAGQFWDYADGVGTNARFKNPVGLTVSAVGDIYVADSEDRRIRKIVQQDNGSYLVSTVAGTGSSGYQDGEAGVTQFGNPLHLASFGSQLALFDQGNAVIRQIQLTPTITVAAGQTTGSFAIEAIDDVVYETDEQILVSASVVSGATLIGDSNTFSAVLTSDDNIPIVALEANRTIVKENGGSLEVKLTLLDEEGAEVIWAKNDLSEETKASFNFLGEFEGHKYYQSFNDVSFDEALSIALSLGGQLLVVDSQEENDFIGRTIRNGAWLGISDEASEGDWTPFYGDSTYLNFDSNNNEPNGGTNENYAVTWGNQWYDVNENNRHTYIIEFGPTKASGLDTVVTLAIGGTASVEAQGEDVADFTLSTQEVVIPAGANSALVRIVTGNDAIDEPIETIELRIASIASFNDQQVGTISSTKNALTVEIDDDEAPVVTFSLSATSLAENKGSTTITANLSNEKVADTEILFNFEGAATFLDDYRSSDLGKVETIAGVLKGSGFVNGPSDIARFGGIWGMAPYIEGSYLLSDFENNTIRKLNADGSVENFIGNGNGWGQETGERMMVSINRPTYLSVDENFNVYFGSQNNKIYKYDASTDRVSILAGSDWGFADGTGQAARFRNPFDVEVNSDGSIIYVLDYDNRTIRKMTRNAENDYEVTSLMPRNDQNQQIITGNLESAQLGRPYEMEVDWDTNLIYVLSNMDWNRTAMSVVDLNQNVLRSTIITNNQGNFRYWGFDLDESDKSMYLTDTRDRTIMKFNYGQPENSRYSDVETNWLFQSHNQEELFKFYQLTDDPNTIEAVVEITFTGGSVLWQGGYQTGTTYGIQSNNTVITNTTNYFRHFEPGVYKIQINTTNLTYSITQTSDVPTRGYTLSKVAGTTRGYADGTADEAKFEMPSSILLDGSSAIVYDDQNELLRKVRIKPALIVEGRSNTASIDLTAHKDQFFEGEEVIELSVSQITNGVSATTTFDNITITDATFLTRVTNAPFEGVQDGKVSWGDYDRDGDMDLLLMGSGTDGTITNIYRNNEGKFENTNQNFTKFLGGDAEFVDVDQDGWLDVALSGNSPKGRVSELYINRGASSPSAPFFQLSENYVVEGLSQSDMEWGDLDNDGDPDLIISGINAQNQYRTLYYTNLGNYTFLQEPLFNAQGRIQAEVDMFDSDNDGDLDLGIAGVDESDNFWFQFFTNSYYGATPNFDANYNFNNYQWLRDGKTLFQDLDVDGRMDYFAMGLDGNRETQQRSNLGVSLNPLSNPDFAFADYNNDGLSDVVITGEDSQGNPVTKLYVTLGGVEFGYRLYETDINLVALRESTVDWIDYDLDGDLDLFMTGVDESGVPVSVLYEANNVANLNEAPAKITNLTADHSANGLVAFEWDKPSDNANTEFRYALRVGTTPGGSDVLYVNATNTGTRLIDEPALSTLNSRELILNPGTYYASVQAIDAGNRGGAFSDEIQFTVDYAWKRLNLGGIIDRSLRPTANSQIEFVDYDGDGDMDLIGSNVGTNYTGNGSAISVFGFENGVFVPKQQIGGGNATFGLGDLNKDGQIDFVYAQEEQQGSRIYPVFNYEGVIAERIAAGETVDGMMSFGQGGNFAGDNLIPSLYDAKIAIKDIDNDGTPEVILAGASSQIESEATAAVYLLRMTVNEGQELAFDNFSFSLQKLIENNAKLEGLSFLSFDLGDVDGDSDYDLLFTGFGFDGYETILFENTGDLNGELFVETNNNFIAVREGSASFVDVDGDGLLDVVFTGQSGEGDAFRVYKNTGNIQSFAALEVGLPAIRKSNIDFGDFNEDGYYDILYSGTIQGEGRTTRLAEFNPTTGQFEDSEFDVSGYLDANVGFGDFDGDGDLDFVLSGEDANNDSGQIQQIADIFINVRDLATAQNSRISLAKEGNNSGLGAPTISTARRRRIAQNSYEVTVEWGGAKNKNGNPDSALTYELKVGTSKNGTEVLSTVANADGVRAVATTGNAESNTSWKLNLPEGTYFAQVQAIDASYQGSEFSEIFEFAVVNSFKLGDANGDDVVNVLDLTTNIEYIMTGAEPTAFVPEVADVNLDGDINVTDISGIVEIILNPETATSRIALSKAVDKSDYFSNKVVGEAELALQNGAVKLRSDREVVALQFSVNKDAAIRINDRLASNFNVVSFERDNRIHYLVYSLNNQDILGVTDQLFMVSGNMKLDVSDLAANAAGVGTLSIEFLDESYLDQYNNGAVFYPNPAREVASLYVGLENAVRVQVELFNMQGTPVLQYATERNVDQINLNVSNLSSGLYAARIQITTEDGRTVTRSLKLVIQ